MIRNVAIALAAIIVIGAGFVTTFAMWHKADSAKATRGQSPACARRTASASDPLSSRTPVVCTRVHKQICGHGATRTTLPA